MKIPIFWLKDYVKLPDLKLLTNKLTMAGHLLDKIEKINGKEVIDLELRGNRADCYSILGIAKEVSALFNTPVNYPHIYKKLKKVQQFPNLKSSVKTKHVKRMMMVQIKNVVICESPIFLKERLAAYGIPSINNIVDLTNFIMLETGEPMHAFDLDLLDEYVEVRLAKSGEKMTTFLDQTLSLTNDDLVWANKTSLLSVAGAIGEKHRSISPNTKNILVEAASYNQANIRRTIYRHNLLTDAGIRHEKDLDPNLVEFAIYRFLQIIDENKWGKIQPEVFDYYPETIKPWTIKLNFEHLNNLSGINFNKNTIINILNRLNIEVKMTSKFLIVKIPTYRTDVVTQEDLIEEILRIYGYEKIPLQKLNLEIPDNVTPSFIKQEQEIRNYMILMGFSEAITLSFVKQNFNSLNVGLEEAKNTVVQINNPPSPDIKYLRISLLPNLYEIAKRAIGERSEEIRYFEIGKVFNKKNSNYHERRKLGFILWKKEGKRTNLIFKGYIQALFKQINLEKINYKITVDFPFLLESFYIISSKKIIGVAGKYGDFYYCEIDLDAIITDKTLYEVNLWPKYPPQIEDLTLIFPKRTSIGEVIELIEKQKFVLQAEVVGNYQDSYSFRIKYQHPDKTLNNQEVEKIRNEILSNLKSKFGGHLKN